MSIKSISCEKSLKDGNKVYKGIKWIEVELRKEGSEVERTKNELVL